MNDVARAHWSANKGLTMTVSRRDFVAGAGIAALGVSTGQGRTENMMSKVPFAATTPISVGRVGLRAKDARALADYYRDVIGLDEISNEGETITLGAGERPLLVIEGDRALTREDPRSAGLFHTAFLLPSRADLGRWINRAADRQIQVDGASDHIVSEALYLTDPEGNGIEIYADRDPGEWKWEADGMVSMATYRMDVPGVRASVPANSEWQGMPQDAIIGHVHLRVGDPVTAEDWWKHEMGFDTVARYGRDAVFLSTGKYHHHIGANAWQSRGAGPRAAGLTGLGWVEMLSRDGSHMGKKADPWGNLIRTRST